jgi:cytochrome c peroxidase
MIRSPTAAALLIAFSLSAAAQDSGAKPRRLSALPSAVPAPKDNPSTPEKIALGKQLFFDKRLSGDNSTSCATCHLSDKALADGLAVAQGRSGRKLDRNTPTLWNAAFLPALTWDGRAASLEEQALIPIQAADEMNQNVDDLETEVSAIPGYAAQFERVFQTKVTRDGIAKSLAAFERTLVAGPSPFDRYLAGDKKALSDQAKRGLELFTGDAGCVRCHNGPMLTDGKFYRLGVESNDEGRAAATKDKQDRGKFRTPSLRNVSATGPYMHNGSLATLDNVVEFYYRGVPTGNAGAALDVEPLSGRSFTEVGDIVAFLESLAGEMPKIEPPQLP